MKREREGYFVIKFKDFNGYQPYVESKCCVDVPTLDINKALPFETRSEAYKFMLKNELDRQCLIEEV